MKVGDIVRVQLRTLDRVIEGEGLIINKKILQCEYRFDIMLATGKTIDGVHERCMEIVNEDR